MKVTIKYSDKHLIVNSMLDLELSMKVMLPLLEIKWKYQIIYKLTEWYSRCVLENLKGISNFAKLVKFNLNKTGKSEIHCQLMLL